MKRDFSEKAKQHLETQIYELEDETLCPLTDALGDLCHKFNYWIGILNINNFTDHVDRYHKKVLDMNNTTKAQLEQIFSNVYSVDGEYADKFLVLTDRMKGTASKMQILSDQLHPSLSIASATTIQKECKGINKELKNSDTKMAATYDKELSYREKKAAIEALKGIPGSVLSFAGDLFGFTAGVAKGVVTGDFTSAASAGWGLINAPFNLGQDLVALSVVGLGLGIGSISGDKKNKIRESTLEYAEDYLERDGLTSELEAYADDDSVLGRIYGIAAKGSKGLDKAKEVYDIYQGAKDITELALGEKIKNPGDFGEQIMKEAGININVTDDGLSLSPDRLKNTKKRVTGSQLRKYNDIYQKAGRSKNIISNIKTGKGYLEAFTDPDKSVGEELFGYTTGGKLFTDTYEFLEELWESSVLVVN